MTINICFLESQTQTQGAPTQNNNRATPQKKKKQSYTMSLNNNNSSNSEPYNPPSPFSPSTQKISNVRNNNKTPINVTSPAQPKCQTCGSRNNCEEDIDNPGDYYCKVCWEEYSAAQKDSSSSQESNNSSRSSSDEKSPAKIDGASTTKNPFAMDKNVENKQDDEGEGSDPLPLTLNPFDNVGTCLKEPPAIIKP